MDTNRVITENAELRRKMRRAGVLVAFICMSTIAMAQTDSAFSWWDFDRFPQLPPLHSGFDAAMMIHPQPNLLLMVLENKHDEVTDDKDTRMKQLMLHHFEENNARQNHYFKSAARNSRHGDALKDVRERIVWERRKNSVNPLPPPTPAMRGR
ncbi:MAG: hypothetical protein J6W56_05130 [Prevotella sp.]|nr:hypothetical protein [Prevotella sp.]